MIAIVGNSSDSLSAIHQKIIREATYVVAADGGANTCRANDLPVHAIVGDMDSVTEENLNFYRNQEVPIQLHPKDKNETDLELAFHWAVRQKASEILVFAWADDRVDYVFEALRYLRLSSVRVRLFGKNYESYILNSYSPHFKKDDLEIGQKVSILQLHPELRLRSEGLKWELDWSPSENLIHSQSNEIQRLPLRLELQSGACLVLIEGISGRKSE